MACQCKSNFVCIFSVSVPHPIHCGRSKGGRQFSHYTGTAVFRFGLKNGSGTTVAVVFRRCASMVNSICSFVPGLENSVLTLANAINFFNSGENAVVVAFPTCRSPE